ncbi:PDZ domain-containing protein [Nautilia sp.]
MRLIKNLCYFGVSFAAAFFLWSIAEFFLPNTPVYHFIPENGRSFFNIRLSHIFVSQNKKTEKSITNKITETLKGVVLKAVYINGKKSFIIVKDKQTRFIDLNGYYKGYKLIKINPDSAVFSKNGNEYIIKFQKTAPDSAYSEKTQNGTFVVNKNVINEYKHNFSKIWRNIGIIKLRQGYKITYVRANSIFQKIGLKKGDVILKVNGKNLSNDAQAWQFYKNIDNYDFLEIEILRNNKIKVLRYELD